MASAPAGEPATSPLTLTLREEHYPYWSRLTSDRLLHSMELFASPGDGDVTVYTAPTDGGSDAPAAAVLRGADPGMGELRCGLLAEPLPAALGTFTLYLDDPTITDLWLTVSWGAES